MVYNVRKKEQDNRVSSPLLDRIDLHVEVPAVKFQEITTERTVEASTRIRDRVIAARRGQQDRFELSRNLPVKGIVWPVRVKPLSRT